MQMVICRIWHGPRLGRWPATVVLLARVRADAGRDAASHTLAQPAQPVANLGDSRPREVAECVVTLPRVAAHLPPQAAFAAVLEQLGGQANLRSSGRVQLERSSGQGVAWGFGEDNGCA